MVCSDKKLAANRANAQNSTGPRTDAGKAASKRNAVKHGLTAEIVAVGGEDQTALDTECKAWIRDLVPTGHTAARFAERAFRAFVQVQRCERANDAALAARVRRAEEHWEIRRQTEVRLAIAQFETAPSVASAKLRSTAEGSRWLIAAWETLAHNLDKGAWGENDYLRATDLLGIEQVGHLPLYKLTKLMDEHREDLRQINVSGFGKELTLENLRTRFNEEFCVDFERNRKVYWECVPRIAQFIRQQIAELREREARLAPCSEADRADAESFCLLDESAEGRLRMRYTRDAERQMHKSASDARAAEEKAKLHGVKRVEAAETGGEPTEAAQTLPLSRNEPTEVGPVEAPDAANGTNPGPDSSPIIDFKHVGAPPAVLSQAV